MLNPIYSHFNYEMTLPQWVTNIINISVALLIIGIALWLLRYKLSELPGELKRQQKLLENNKLLNEVSGAISTISSISAFFAAITILFFYSKQINLAHLSFKEFFILGMNTSLQMAQVVIPGYFIFFIGKRLYKNYRSTHKNG